MPNRRLAPALLLISAALPALARAGTVAWVDWQTTDSSAGTVTGEATTEAGTTVAVTYTGEWGFVQTSCGTDYWAGASSTTYLSSVVDNAPDDSGDSATMCDIIALRYKTSKTLEFSEPVTNPLFAVVSLNGNGYGFDRDFEILSYGTGYWGTGTLTKTTETASDGSTTYNLIGSGEPHGVIQFTGTFSSVTWTSLSNEYWNGFNIAIEDAAVDVPPEIAVFDGADTTGVELEDEQPDAVDFGTVNVGDALTRTFTIEDQGTGPLNFSDLWIEGDGAYTVTELPLAIGAGETTTFDITFTPSDSGAFDATVYIASDDDDEDLFSFPITGTGQRDTDGDGVLDAVDNCVYVSNPDQGDADGDGLGDLCDDCTDADGDGFGDPDFASIAECASDCDDADARVSPDEEEICDGLDNDCDGEIDEGDGLDAATWYTDSDGDGYGDPDASVTACTAPDGTVSDGADCDDADGAVYLGADELCDGVDNDCDGVLDEDALDASTWYADGDRDGYGDPDASTTACDAPDGAVSDHTDCDDARGDVSPAGVEVAYDGVDQDCDGQDLCDVDGDGFDAEACGGSDCDDEDAAAFPDAPELGDGVDRDCDGDTDEDALTDAEEAALGTDPLDPDSDDDGLSDGEEVNTYGTDPNDADTDDGSVSDGDEVAAGTDPLDGADDVEEIDTGTPDTGTPDVPGEEDYYKGGCSCASAPDADLSLAPLAWGLGLAALARRRRARP